MAKWAHRRLLCEMNGAPWRRRIALTELSDQGEGAGRSTKRNLSHLTETVDAGHRALVQPFDVARQRADGLDRICHASRHHGAVRRLNALIMRSA